MSRNLIIFTIVLVLILALGGYYLMGKTKKPYTLPTQESTTQSPTSPTTEGVGKEIKVGVKDYSFSPKSISVTKGEKVTITLKNSGALPHNFTISELGVATKTIGSGETDSVTFVADKAGTFTYFCSVPGHKALGLEGTLEVR